MYEHFKQCKIYGNMVLFCFKPNESKVVQQMCMRRIIFLNCSLFPSRSCDLYLQLLAAALQTLITGIDKHVTRPEWIWKGKSVPRRKWKSPPGRPRWTVRCSHTSLRAAPEAARHSRRAHDGLPSRGRRAESLLSTNPMGVWLTGKRGSSFDAYTQTNCIGAKRPDPGEMWFF